MPYFVEPPPDDAKEPVYPCGTCNKKIGKRMRAIQCSLCNFKNHIKCDQIDPSFYITFKNSKTKLDYFC